MSISVTNTEAPGRCFKSVSFISHALTSAEIDGDRTTFLGPEALDLRMCLMLACRELFSLCLLGMCSLC